MSDFHQQAIEDVARAMGVSIDDVKYYMRPGMSSSKLAVYAVAQRERVLELEAAVLWALGYEVEDGDFRERRKGEGAYWWRNELAERAKVTTTRDALTAPEKAQP